MPPRELTFEEEYEISNALKRLKIAPTIVAPSLDDYYRVAPIPDKGQGCLARRPITRGTRILEEAPLFSFLVFGKSEDSGDSGFLAQVFGNLTLDNLKPFNAELLTQAFGNLTLGDLKSFNALDSVKGDNSISIASDSNNMLVGVDHEQTQAGIFKHASRFNHSCLPNAFCTWNEHLGADPRGRLTIHAIRDIAAGEEILINYRNEDAQKARIDRMKELKDDYDFVCNCPACDTRAPNAARAEDNRQWIREIIQARGKEDDLTAPSRKQRYSDFLELQKLDELLENEGIIYPQRARAYGWMAEWCARELSQETVALDRQECRELGLKAARSKLDLDIICNGYSPFAVQESLDMIRKLA